MKEFLRDHLVSAIGIFVGIIVMFAVALPLTSWSNSVTVQKVATTVYDVGPPKKSTYQCGSTKVGDVTIPTYCTRTEYKTTFVVIHTDEKFSDSISTKYTVGDSVGAYHVIDGSHRSYSLSSPKGPMAIILYWFMGIVAGSVAGVIAGATVSYFEEY